MNSSSTNSVTLSLQLMPSSRSTSPRFQSFWTMSFWVMGTV